MAKAATEQQQQSWEDKGGGTEGEGRAVWELFPVILRLKINKYNAFSFEVALLAALRLAPLLHTLFAYLLLTRNPARQQLNDIIDVLAGNGSGSALVQSCLYLLKAGEVAAVWLEASGDEEAKRGRANNKAMRNFNVLVQLDLVLSAFTLFGNFWQNLVGFVVTAVLYVFSALFLANYYDRRDVLYLSSITDNLFLTVATLLSFMVNAVCFQLGTLSWLSLVDLLLSIVLLVWFMKYRFLLIPHSGFRLWLLGVVVGKAGMAVCFFDGLLRSHEISLVAAGVKVVLSCSVLLLCVRVWQSNLQVFETLFASSGGQAKRFDVFLWSLMEEASSDRQREHFIISMLSREVKTQATLHDYRSRTEVATRATSQEGELRAELRRVYLRALAESPGEVGLMVDYCEFVLNEFGNCFEVCERMVRARGRPAGYLEQLRLAKLRHILRDSNEAFNATVFEGCMELEHMIVAEDTFDAITEGIEAAISLEMRIWKAIGGERINLTEVRGQIGEKLQLLRVTSERWARIGKYLRHQRRWRYIFMNYSFFLLNRRLYSRDAEDSRSMATVTEDAFFLGETAHLLPNDSRERLYAESLLFDKKAFYLRARLVGETLVILKVSRSFPNFVEYSEEEVVGSPVHLLMPEELRWTHDEKVLQWLRTGACADETLYAARFTSFLTKEGEEVPAVKYFKLFVDVSEPHLLDFVCLLKANEPDLPPDNDESEAVSEASVSGRGIQRDFSTTKRGNLRPENNIFIKEQNLRSNASIREITEAKRAIRLLTGSLVGLLVMLLLVTRRDTGTLDANITQFLNFLNLYRFPMALTKNYMKNFLAVGNQASVTSQIIAQTQNVIAFNSDPLTLRTLFDPALNAPALYGPFRNDSFNRGLVYDQVEIYSLVISCITSLGRLPINRTGYDFAMLNMYLIPSYDHMINATKIRFHETFQENLSRMLVDQLIVGCLEGVFFVVILVFVGLRVARYFRKGRHVMQIVFDFSELNVRRVERYWKNLLQHFQKLHIRNKAYCLQTSASLRATQRLEIDLDIDIIRLKLQKEQNINCNKRQKTIFETKRARVHARRALVGIGAGLLVVILALLSIEASNLVQITRMQGFENDGFYFLRYFPATSVLGHALMERYYYQVKPAEVRYSPERYQEYISDLWLIGQSEYIGPEIDSSAYYKKQKNYMFGNPCLFAPQVLAAANSNLTACLTGFNRTLSLGITTFLRAVHPAVEQYLNLRANMTVAQLNDVTTTLTLVAYYITDAITTWAAEFRADILRYEGLDTTLCLVAVAVVLLLHLVFCEKLLFYFLERDYQFVREVFDKMVPNFIVSLEKVIRQKFVVEGIVQG